MTQVEWTPSQAEFDSFARVSGDDNPIHVDADFSAQTRFGRTVSHGMLIYARLWQLLRRDYPDARHAMQEMMFPNPAYAGEPLVLRIEDTGADVIMTAARRADGAVCFQGRAVLS